MDDNAVFPVHSSLNVIANVKEKSGVFVESET